MGGWKLEVGKMAFYLAFPLCAFHIFNQPAYFEKWVIETKRIFYPPEDEHTKSILESVKSEMREQRNAELLAAIKESEAKYNNM